MTWRFNKLHTNLFGRQKIYPYIEADFEDGIIGGTGITTIT